MLETERRCQSRTENKDRQRRTENQYIEGAHSAIIEGEDICPKQKPGAR
jgi:hypothetical protein